MALLGESEIESGLDRLDGWARAATTIRRTFEFESFPAAIEFVGRVAAVAEEADHHPDIDIRHTRVTLVLSTHSEGGLTRRDLRLAGRIDRLVGRTDKT